ncbi:unnamed protein product, partial [Ectocarpus sp. 12 AP-2014]
QTVTKKNTRRDPRGAKAAPSSYSSRRDTWERGVNATNGREFANPMQHTYTHTSRKLFACRELLLMLVSNAPRGHLIHSRKIGTERPRRAGIAKNRRHTHASRTLQ